MNSDLPLIQKHLPSAQHLATAIYLQPVLNQQVFNVDSESMVSPASTVLALRVLRLKKRMAVPFHRHAVKEKAYFFRGGTTIVYFYVGSAVHTFEYSSGMHLVLPPGTPHALYCTEDSEILIVSSTKDSADIVWQDDVSELVKNKHLVV